MTKPQPRVGIGVFVWKNGKFFMGLRKGAHGSNTWSVPGGHLEHGESWEQCAKREVMEETGMKIKNVKFFAATNDFFEESGKHYTTIWVESDWASGKPKVLEPDKWVGQEWRDFSTLPSPLFEPCWQNLRKTKPELLVS